MICQHPLFKLGVIADPQYADQADGHVEGRNQRYREVPWKLGKAVHALNAEGVRGLLTLGDMVDGPSKSELRTVVDLLSHAVYSTYHVIGNHDLAVTRELFMVALSIPACYYSRQLCCGWTLVVLDTTDMCPVSGFPESSPQMQETRTWQAAHPPLHHPNMQDWNGGVAAGQRRWLEVELASAAAAGERVIVAAHHPIGEGSCRATHRAWNADWLQATLTSPASPVALVFAGHDHVGGYACIDGVHFITVEAMLEAPQDSNAFGVLSLYEDEALLTGHGTVTSRRLALRPRPACDPQD